MREKLLEDSAFIIHSVISKYVKYFDRDDLYQVGMIGLLEALNHYDESKNTKFSSFAYFYVKGEVTKYIRESNILKISKEYIELNKRIEKIRD